MTRTFRHFALLLAGLAAAGSAHAAPALWAASDGDSTIYLFGTAHAVRADAKWRTPALDKALASSKALWLEIETSDDRSATLAVIQKLGMDPAASLATKLTPAMQAKLEAVLAQYGLPAAQVAPMRPWLAAMTLAMLPLAKAGLDPKAGADSALRESAKAQGDRIEGFDTPERQVRYLADLPEAEQIAFLENVLDRAAGGTDLPLKIAAAWEQGDLATIDSVLNSELKAKAPSLYRRLLVERNVRYADSIVELLARDQDQLVAVGVGHLVGSDSIVAMLEAKGIALRRIQ
ncbi:MAG TPA: TraB/GumN family protein [Allosphingosinicella sp.]|nr:TraB/GumN family protein [Allosphingosinicella sp.]